jgi:hypothetical protein
VIDEQNEKHDDHAHIYRNIVIYLFIYVLMYVCVSCVCDPQGPNARPIVLPNGMIFGIFLN